MASIDLLEEARAKGLEIRIDGEQLVVRGPRAARPVAEALLASKTEILAAIRLGQEHRVWLDSLSLADRLRYDRAFGRTWAAGCDTEPCRRMARAEVETSKRSHRKAKAGVEDKPSG